MLNIKKQSEIIFKYLDYECYINLGHYQDKNKRIAMIIASEYQSMKNYPISKLSTNLPNKKMNDNEIAVCIDDHNHDLLNVMVQEGILIDTDMRLDSEWKTYGIYKLNFEIDKPFIS